MYCCVSITLEMTLVFKGSGLETGQVLMMEFFSSMVRRKARPFEKEMSNV